MSRPPTSLEFVNSAYKVYADNRQLIVAMTKRELTEQYSGKIFGWFWAIFHPLFIASIYITLFSYVFKVKIDSDIKQIGYATFILSGLIPWMGCQQILLTSCMCLFSNANMVKQIAFPVEVIPIKSALANFVGQIVSLAALVTYVLFKNGTPPLTYMLIPVLVTFQLLLLQGCSFFLSAISVFFRDTKEIVQASVVGGIYLTPVFYNMEWLPSWAVGIVYANPFSHVILAYQDALFYGEIVHPCSWVVFFITSITAFFFGLLSFQRMKPIFGNVL